MKAVTFVCLGLRFLPIEQRAPASHSERRAPRAADRLTDRLIYLADALGARSERLQLLTGGRKGLRGSGMILHASTSAFICSAEANEAVLFTR